MVRRASSVRVVLLLSLATAGCADTLGGDEGSGASSQTGDACEAKQDAEGVPVTVRFFNASSAEIYVWTDCDTPDRPDFFLLRENVEVSVDKVPCEGTCGQAQTDEEPYCPILDCERGKLLRIEANVAYDFEWLATEQVLSSMPASCYHSSKVVENDCWLQIDLEGPVEASGRYFLPSQVHHSLNPSNVYGCPCDLAADTDGVCEIDTVSCQVTGSEIGFEPVSVDLSGGMPVELTATGT